MVHIFLKLVDVLAVIHLCFQIFSIGKNSIVLYYKVCAMQIGYFGMCVQINQVEFMIRSICCFLIAHVTKYKTYFG